MPEQSQQTHTQKMWSSVQSVQRGRWQLCETGVNGSPGTRLMPAHPHSLTHTQREKGGEMPAVTLATCIAARIHEKSDSKRRCVCMCVCRWAGPPRGEAMAGILITLRDRTGDQYMILATYHKQLNSNSIHNQ